MQNKNKSECIWSVESQREEVCKLQADNAAKNVTRDDAMGEQQRVTACISASRIAAFPPHSLTPSPSPPKTHYYK